VETNADIILASSKDALRKTEHFQDALAGLAASPNSTQALSEAKEALTLARQAFRQAEVAVFYSDPDAPIEMLALPDPDNSARLGKDAYGFNVIETLLNAYAPTVKRDEGSDTTKFPDEIVIQALMGQAQDLRTNINQFTAAWDKNDPSNFRHRYFARSPKTGIQRIFQGYLTMINAVLPERENAEGTGREDLSISLKALRNLYLGTYQSRDGTLIGGPGIRAVIEQTDTQAAQSIDSGFLNAMEVAIQPQPDAGKETDTPTPFSDSLELLKSDWTRAAGSLRLHVEKDQPLQKP
jgi:hypothetical protein